MELVIIVTSMNAFDRYNKNYENKLIIEKKHSWVGLIKFIVWVALGAILHITFYIWCTIF